MLIIIVAVISFGALLGCQSNTAGKLGYVPNTCAAPASSCTRTHHEAEKHFRLR
jgi:hypothetical protein